LSQLRFVTTGGADIPLIEAQKNYVDFGASERGFLRNVREPTPEDIRERSWRPLYLQKDNSEVPVLALGYGTTYPDDHAVPYYWRPTYWRK
jgi:hypothetical protein